ncbi:MAG: glycerol-3-phosphate acyltransferase [Anaerolineae bacterium]
MIEPTWPNIILWASIAFACGSLPLAVWIGRLAGVDIRSVGDGNPGATNVLKAAGAGWGMLAFCAEFSKAAVPVGIIYMIFGWHGYEVIPIALAPSLGHAFSPLLNGKGGKALATMLGAWIGTTLWVMPTIILTVLVFMHLVIKPKKDLWSVLPTIGAGFIWFFGFDWDPVLATLLAVQLLFVLYTHRGSLNKRPL